MDKILKNRLILFKTLTKVELYEKKKDKQNIENLMTCIMGILLVEHLQPFDFENKDGVHVTMATVKEH